MTIDPPGFEVSLTQALKNQELVTKLISKLT